MSLVRVRSALNAASVLSMIATAAHAQDVAPPATATAMPTSDNRQLEEITVTARKVGESILTAPVAITALTGEALSERGVRGFDDLNSFAPGLRYQNTSANRNDRGFHTIVTRGIFPGDSPNRQAVTVFVDGVPIPGGAIPGLNDVERVEVVNGPQSAYFGRSTFAGAINFITREPGFEFHGNATVDYSSFNTIEVAGGVEGPLVQDMVALRVSARHYSTDGAFKNVGYSGRLGARETNSVAANIVIKPMQDLKLRGYLTYWEDSDGPTAQALYDGADYNCAANPLRPTTLNYICGPIRRASASRMSQNIMPGQGAFELGQGQPVLGNFIDHLGLERQAYQANLIADYSFDDYAVTATVGRNSNKFAALTDTFNKPPQPSGFYTQVYLPYDQRNTSAELRVTTPQQSRLRILAGANYFNEKIDFQTRLRNTGGVIELTRATRYTAETIGLFGSAAFDFSDALTLSVEARYQWDKVGQIARFVNGPAPAQDTFKSFSPRAILSYHVRPDLELYASYARGTRPGTFNIAYYSLSQFVRDQVAARGIDVPYSVAEEKLTMYEGGIKGEFFDRRIRLLGAFYYGEWKDRQINQSTPQYLPSPGATITTASTFVLPGGMVNLWGAEIQATVKATESITIDATFGYNETDIRVTTCAECVTIGGPGVQLVGNRIPRYPAYTGSVGVSYDRELSADWRGTVRADYIYTGRQYDTEANLAWAPPANRVNLRAGINNGVYSIEIYGRNIFDNKVPSNISRFGSPLNGSSIFLAAAPDRATIGLRAGVKF